MQNEGGSAGVYGYAAEGVCVPLMVVTRPSKIPSPAHARYLDQILCACLVIGRARRNLAEKVAPVPYPKFSSHIWWGLAAKLWLCTQRYLGASTFQRLSFIFQSLCSATNCVCELK